MKRKIALLLALIMILSLVPATFVSADTPPPNSVGTPLFQGTGVGNDQNGALFTLNVHAHELWGALRNPIPPFTAGTVHIRVDLTGYRSSESPWLSFLPGSEFDLFYDELEKIPFTGALPATVNLAFINELFASANHPLLNDPAHPAQVTAAQGIITAAIATVGTFPDVLGATRQYVPSMAAIEYFVENDEWPAGMTTVPADFTANVVLGGLSVVQSDQIDDLVDYWSLDVTEVDPVALGVVPAPDLPNAEWIGAGFPLDILNTAALETGMNMTAGTLEARMWTMTRTFAIIELSAAAGSVPANAPSGTVSLAMPFPIRANHENHTLTARLWNSVGPVIAQGPLLATAAQGINITRSGDPVTFEWDARLGNINIAERRFNAIPNGTHTVRLQAPIGYSWGFIPTPATNPPAWHAGPGPNGANLAYAGATQAFTFANTSWAVFEQSNGRSELAITTTITRATTGPLAVQTGTWAIRGLMLIPDEHTPLTGELYVGVRLGTGVGKPGHNTTFPANSTAVHNWNINWESVPAQEHGNDVDLLVARRVVPGLEMTIVEDSLTDLRSGYAIGAGQHRPFVEELEGLPWVPNQGAAATTGRTGIIRIEENVVNALDLSRGRPIYFNVPEGVVVTGIQWRYHRVDRQPTGGINPWNINTAYGNGNQVARPLPGATSTDVDVSFVDDTTVRIRPWVSSHLDNSQRPNRLRLEVRLFVSVAAGAEAAGLDAVEVNVSGAGVRRLGPDGEGSIVAATIYDPIFVSHENPAEIMFAGNEQNIQHAQAGTLVIEEAFAGALQRGTRLWVSVVPRYGIGFPLNISRNDVLVDPGSGMGLTVRDVSPATTDQARRTIVLEVTRQSTGNNPGSITIDALTLFGHVYPGEEYYFIVTGPAVAENHRPVWQQWNATTMPSGNMPPVLGTFMTAPYANQAVVMTDVHDQRGQANSLAGVVFDPTVAIGGIVPPVIWERLPGMAHEAGFVAARSFAVLAGVTDENINWSSGVATISGWNVQGQWVTVILTQNSTTATVVVDGAVGTVDIAEFAEGQSGPTGTVAPIFRNNRIYLPFRFLFNAFGYSADYTLSRVGNTAVVGTR